MKSRSGRRRSVLAQNKQAFRGICSTNRWPCGGAPAPSIIAMKRLIGIPLELQCTRLGGTTAGDATYQRFKAAYARCRDAHAAAARVMRDAPDTLAELKRTGVLHSV